MQYEKGDSCLILFPRSSFFVEDKKAQSLLVLTFVKVTFY